MFSIIKSILKILRIGIIIKNNIKANMKEDIISMKKETIKTFNKQDIIFFILKPLKIFTIISKQTLQIVIFIVYCGLLWYI